MERQRVLKRVSIRNKHSKYKSNPRVFDVVLIGKRVFFEVKTGKDQLERIPFEDVIEQVESAVLQEQHHCIDQFLIACIQQPITVHMPLFMCSQFARSAGYTKES